MLETVILFDDNRESLYSIAFFREGGAKNLKAVRLDSVSKSTKVYKGRVWVKKSRFWAYVLSG